MRYGNEDNLMIYNLGTSHPFTCLALTEEKLLVYGILILFSRVVGDLYPYM